MAMGAILATIADDGEQAIVDIDREAGRNKLISCLIHTLIINLLTAALPNPLLQRLPGVGCVPP
jgi:hypothetical protein